MTSTCLFSADPSNPLSHEGRLLNSGGVLCLFSRHAKGDFQSLASFIALSLFPSTKRVLFHFVGRLNRIEVGMGAVGKANSLFGGAQTKMLIFHLACYMRLAELLRRRKTKVNSTTPSQPSRPSRYQRLSKFHSSLCIEVGAVRWAGRNPKPGLHAFAVFRASRVFALRGRSRARRENPRTS